MGAIRCRNSREEPVNVSGVEDFSKWGSGTLSFVNVGLADASGHGKVGDGCNTVDEQSRDVESSVSVGDLLRECSEEEEASSHDTEDDPEVSLTSLGALLRAERGVRMRMSVDGSLRKVLCAHSISRRCYYSLVEVWWDWRNANVAVTTMVLEVGAYVVDEVVKVGVHILR